MKINTLKDLLVVQQLICKVAPLHTQMSTIDSLQEFVDTQDAMIVRYGFKFDHSLFNSFINNFSLNELREMNILYKHNSPVLDTLLVDYLKNRPGVDWRLLSTQNCEEENEEG